MEPEPLVDGDSAAEENSVTRLLAHGHVKSHVACPAGRASVPNIGTSESAADLACWFACCLLLVPGTGQSLVLNEPIALLSATGRINGTVTGTMTI